MTDLLLSALVFVGGHFILSASAVRPHVVKRTGEWPFVGLYSTFAAGSFWWMIQSYVSAPFAEIWSPPVAFQHLAISVMPLVCILLIAGYTSANPTAMGFGIFKGLERGPSGIFRVTRHPILWAVGLWALVHLLANGTDGDLIFFGALTLLAVGGAVHIDRRKETQLGDAWLAYKAETSSIPFLAIAQGRQRFVLSEIRFWRIAAGLALYVAMLLVHQTVIGASPLPMP